MVRHILTAARRLVDLDEKQINAVSLRTEVDLRTGFAFTRFLTTSLRALGGPMAELTISYGIISPRLVRPQLLMTVVGSCQFPTLGFVVDRYFKVKNFVPETFWSIKVTHTKDGVTGNFSWARNRLFDRFATVVLYERCLAAKRADVIKVHEKPTKKWKPLPLTTVEMQKMATIFLRMSGQQALNVAESLYQKGFISYPRTETDRFDRAINLRPLVEKQTPDNRWGAFAQNLINGSFQQPRQGRHDDKAHPPIHPITYASPSVLDENERKVYELVVRRFLACCSDDAKGMATDIEVLYGSEKFTAHGIIVLERNYLDIYPYEKWSDSAQLPKLRVGERFEPAQAMMTEGKTTPPGYLTEADLIALMDANGIGTDATMAEHIQKIQDRNYAQAIARAGDPNYDADEEESEQTAPARGGRGGRGDRGGRGSRGGRGGGGGSGGVRVFVPTKLGVALIDGFDRMNFETSLGKPFLRREMEQKMKAICNGRSTRPAVLRECVAQYRRVFDESNEKLNCLKLVRRRPRNICRRWLLIPFRRRADNTCSNATSASTFARLIDSGAECWSIRIGSHSSPALGCTAARHLLRLLRGLHPPFRASQSMASRHASPGSRQVACLHTVVSKQ
jgi:DNA topoisomerase III